MSCAFESKASGREMDYTICNIVYVDRNARRDGLVAKVEDITSLIPKEDTENSLFAFCRYHTTRTSVIGHNLQLLLSTFKGVYVCTSGKSCIAKLADLNQASTIDLVPTLVIVDVPPEDYIHETHLSDSQFSAPNSEESFTVDTRNVSTGKKTGEYGLPLLRRISSNILDLKLSKLIIPLAMVSPSCVDASSSQSNQFLDAQKLKYVKPEFTTSNKRTGLPRYLDPARTVRILNTGAVEVLISPIREEGLSSLAIHAYRAHKGALQGHRALMGANKDRKRSWVGLNDEKPYAYLREAMVSGLMDKICQIGNQEEPPTYQSNINIPSDRKTVITTALGSWDFSAHRFSDDELMYAALLMLQHVLSIPELESWRMSTEKLSGFLLASRSAYNTFVPYHNFRHVVDVLQACFFFLIRLGRIPPYLNSTEFSEPKSSVFADSIRPFDALTLLITAIGHDVGHPGVNNTFLVTLDAPLAQLYNDRSVLESFHCAAFSQILRCHWPAAFQAVEMRKLMIKTILATDMGLHFDYMTQMNSLQEKLQKGSTQKPDILSLEEWRILACSLLIKCADISNVARTHDVASKWTMILTDEFARQAAIEKDLGIRSTLFATPVREIIALGKSQIEFMNLFAFPLFRGVSELMPAMNFCVEKLKENRLAWQKKVSGEKLERQSSKDSILTGSTDVYESANDTASEEFPQRLNNQSIFDHDVNRLTIPEHIIRDPCLPEISNHCISQAQYSPGSTPNDKIIHQPLKIPQKVKPVSRGLPYMVENNNVNLNQIENRELTVNASADELILARNIDILPRSEKKIIGDTSLIAGDWVSLTRSRNFSSSPPTPSPSTTPDSEPDKIISPGQILPMPFLNQPFEKCVIDHTPDPSAEDSEDENHTNKILAVENITPLRKRPSRFRINFWKRNKSGGQSTVPVGGFGPRGDVDTG
ncbi:hypothetical protein K3495_g8390 [Podosphaera aphanis]|nr:hypothetical protein K3495_g8390 [Podosphaera aphanis]